MDIIQEIKTGEESTFRSIFYQYHSKLYYYFLKKSRSEEMSRELVQLTFIKLWQFRHTLSGNHPFELQLFNIANSTFIDLLRRQQTHRAKIVEMPIDAEDAFEATQQANDFEQADHLQSLIQSLSPVRKKIFILSRIQGHSYKEIAQQLSISVKTVEDHIGKALKHIRALFF
ncbi:sigma-70 family RNA polymerase sigma factor [Niastella yeongjuensis]|uniref:sigma-70 family RNA polymerase sigma factor n=1 Tax=Niastella yeongjuensis TaxID=354355 RepID=UPI0013FDFF0E|nr:sigma-70 family RNA polymerase sigma factor [Niastella yeongjuensis]